MTELKEEILNNWQNIVELLAKVLDVSCVAITEHDNKYLKIVKTNKSDENPFKDDMMPEMAGLYCASVINSKRQMQIPNIKKDDLWKNNPYADNGLISYLGYPIVKHDGSIFGTLCVLDNREREHSESTIELLKEFKIIIEKQLENIYLSRLTHSILDSLNSAIVILDNDNVIKYTNELGTSFINTDGIDLDMAIGLNYTDVGSQFKSREGKSVCDGIKKVVSKEMESFVGDYQIENTSRWCRIKVTPFIGGGDYSVVIMHEDITKAKEIEEEMNRNRAFFQQLFDKSPESIALLDVNGKIINVNKSFENLFGYSAEETIDKSFTQLIVPECEKTNEANISRMVFAGETFMGETISKTKKGAEIFVDIIRYPIFVNNKISGAYAIYEDITERKKEEENIRFLSFHDQLTKLYNRRYFDNELKQIDNETNLPITIIIGDLDKLKMINDSFGHGQGDVYLIKAAEIIRSIVGESGVVARIGGDEFGIILPHTDESTAKKLVQEIQTKFYSENQNSNPTYSISLGTATKTDLRSDIATILKQADNDMYKNKGSSQFYL
jgi:diguanylate cyclase (GGDEF)-like protein/PAS domain S-box-containing protein